eukprot:TRINITY_DN15766_c0_g2_i1.p1 TRINITY_DN15766_c0_g2~~TRINITY_DN15766_c0_g2_i1.p1  ORF type:complete len:112 (+),score=7.17 TRINITY_DN15766_c0_g2_i1:483-818(+)
MLDNVEAVVSTQSTGDNTSLVKSTTLQPPSEPLHPETFDQSFLESLDVVFVPTFKNIQNVFYNADQFDHHMCLDFSLHPNVFPVFQKEWLKQTVYERVRLHFRTACEVDDI